jgi:DNA-binding transcriptional MerR regulator
MNDSQPLNRPLSIGELADLTGVSRRTVRFYVQRGLIDPPVGLGRASHYTTVHAEQIQRVVALQRGGLLLEEISTLPAEKLEAVAAAESGDRLLLSAKMVLRVALAPGVRLELDAGTTPPTAEQLRKLAEAAKKIFSE